MSTAAPVFAHLPGWGFAGLALQLNTVLLVAGLITLSGGLLVLLFTRWGQARPLAKCAALSVFAHLLLLASACGIRLFNEPPGPFREEVIRLSMLDADPSPQAEPREPAAVPEELPTEPAAVPRPSELAADQVPQPPRLPDAVGSQAPPPELTEAPVEAAPPAAPPELLPSPPTTCPLRPNSARRSRRPPSRNDCRSPNRLPRRRFGFRIRRPSVWLLKTTICSG